MVGRRQGNGIELVALNTLYVCIYNQVKSE